MHHWQTQADAVECEIQAQLRAGVPLEQLSKQRKMADDYRTMACDAAARLAPYIHPKIGEVPVKTDGATEYVIVVPPLIHASEEWVRAVNAKLIDAKPNGDGSGNGSGR
jgi:hypothetical protein